MTCQKEQGVEGPENQLLVLSFAISSMCGLTRPQFPKHSPSGALQCRLYTFFYRKKGKPKPQSLGRTEPR